MEATYQVQFTTTAEKDYRKFYNQAQASIKEGKKDSRRISLFNSIEKALDEILPINPVTSGRSLAGCLSPIFMLNLGPICIYYLANVEENVAYILHIGPNQRGADLSRLKDAVVNGRAGEILEQLGIERSHLLEGAPTDWLN